MKNFLIRKPKISIVVQLFNGTLFLASLLAHNGDGLSVFRNFIYRGSYGVACDCDVCSLYS